MLRILYGARLTSRVVDVPHRCYPMLLCSRDCVACVLAHVACERAAQPVPAVSVLELTQLHIHCIMSNADSLGLLFDGMWGVRLRRHVPRCHGMCDACTCGVVRRAVQCTGAAPVVSSVVRPWRVQLAEKLSNTTLV
jgi:hypothetical protein